MADVFVSYSRHDAGFVHELHAFLTAAGRDVWVDWEDIPAASKWEQDIDDSIDAAESVVFVVSPSSLASEYCGEELRHAGAGGKRVVPIAIDGADPEAAPPALRQLNWIWCRETDDREAAFAALGRALDTDLDWSRAHTRLLVRAVEWDARRDKSLLLRGKDLEEAERQLAAHGGKDPRTTELQQRYLHESRRSTSRRQRSLLGGVTAALVVSVAFGVLALLQRNTANERARIAESQTLSLQAVDALETSPELALGHAIDAFETERTPEARSALRRAILANPIELAIPAARKPRTNIASPQVEFSGDARRLLGLTPGGTLRVWNQRGRDVVERSTVRDAALGPGGRVLSARRRTVRLVQGGRTTVRSAPTGMKVVGVGFAGRRPLALVAGRGRAFLLDIAANTRTRLDAPRVAASDPRFGAGGRLVATLGSKTQVWDTHGGRLVAALPDALEVVLAPDGRSAITSGVYRGTELWSLPGAARLARLGDDVWSVAYSPAGDLAVALGSNGEARIWNARSGRLSGTLPGFGNPAPKSGFSTTFNPAAAFSRDGRLAAFANGDGIVRVWELATRKQVGAVEAGWVNALAFAPRGGRLAAMTWDGDVVVARAPASLPIASLPIDTGFEGAPACPVAEPRLSPDGRLIAAPVTGGAGLWRSDGTFVRVLEPPARFPRDATAVAIAFSGDGTRIAVSATRTVCITRHNLDRFGAAVWNTGGGSPVLSIWFRSPRSSRAVELDESGGVLATDHLAFRTENGARLRGLDRIHALSPDGRHALVFRGREARVVEVPSGRTAAVLEDSGRLATSEADGVAAAFSPDGERLLTGPGGALRLWDPRTGEEVARLDRPTEPAQAWAFADGGRRVHMRSGERAAVFDAGGGRLVASSPGWFDTMSDDGRFGVRLGTEGALELVELATGLTTAIQTDTARPLRSPSFGPAGEVLLADDSGVLHLLRCPVCAGDDELIERARATQERLAEGRPKELPNMTLAG